MSVPAGIEGGPAEVNEAAAGTNTEPTDNGGQETGGESINPNWTPLLEKLPSSLHPLVTPQLKEWDGKFQEQLQQVHSQYDPYKPFLEAKVPAEQIEQALNFFNLVNTDPQFIYEQLAEFYGYGGQGQEDPSNPGGQQGQGAEETFDFNNPDIDIMQHPKVKELFENQQALAQHFVQTQEQERLAAAEAQIETELSQVKEKYPNIDELLIFQTATGGNMTLTQAAEMLNHQYEQMLQQSRQPAPRVFSATGGLPAQQAPDPKKLNSQGTQDLVEQILRGANGQG